MKLKLYSYIIIATASIMTCATSQTVKKAPIKPVSFTQVHLTDSFWASRIETNRTVSIPSAFHQCEINGRFDNFAIAAGLMKGEQKGDFPFDDTDPYKIIEGASYTLAVKYDKKLDDYLDSVINLISRAQEPDGYLTTCVTNKATRLSGWWGTHRWEKINSHELYNSGHLIEAAVAHYQATGKHTLLNVAIKNADLICEVFGPNEGQIHRPSGHPIVEMALAKLYEVTDNKKYLETAKYFVDETGRGTDGHKLSEYSQDHEPILKQDEIKGHAVRAGYLYSGVADVASLTGDTAYTNALKRIWDNMAGDKLYITGGIGSRAMGEGFGPDYELNNQTAYCETCASIANVFWNQRMYQDTGDAKYVDVLERGLYNGVISGVSLSGDKFFYDNPLESDGQHNREPWFGCACCPGNITRFMASVPKYMYATQGEILYINLFTQSTSTIDIHHKKVNVNQVTKYPWEGNIQFLINPSSNLKFPIKIRIPGWVGDKPVQSNLYTFVDKGEEYSVKVNGKPVFPKEENGYITLEQKWKAGDVIELNLPMPVRRVKANSKVDDDLGKVSFERGPVMYCIEGTDFPDKQVFNKFIPLDTKIDYSFDDKLLNGVVKLFGTAKEIDKDSNNNIIVKDVKFTAIPYSTWDNRGPDEMVVWIPYSEKYALPVPDSTIASRAECVDCYGVNDQFEPKSSGDISKPYFYWWLKSGTKEKIEYKFSKPEKISNVEVYWLVLDHYDRSYRVPESWKLYYKDGEEWKEVDALSPYTTKADCYNELNFEPVTTTGLKIEVQLQKDYSGGVLEWKVN